MENHKCIHDDLIPEIDKKMDRALILLEDENIGLCNRVKTLENNNKVISVVGGFGILIGYFLNLFR